MRKKKITISDVAREMRVSVTTVSFVLNDKAEGRVSPSLARRIRAYADRIGYRPNAGAKRKGKVKLYGLLMEDIRSPFQRALAFHIEEQLRLVGNHALIMSMNGDVAQAAAFVQILGTMDLSGAFLMIGDAAGDRVSIKRAWRGPVVALDTESENVWAVGPDYEALVHKVLLDHARETSLGRVGLICCAANPTKSNRFVKGYMGAMETLNGDVLVKKIPYNNDDTTREQIADFLRDNRLDTAVFSSDRLARLALEDSEMLRQTAVRCVVSPSHQTGETHPVVRQLTLGLDAEILAGEVARQFLGKD